MKLEISSHQRSKKVIMTDEARVLNRLREDCGLSLRHFSERRTPQDELRELVEQLAPDRVAIALEIIKQVAEGRRVIAV